MIPSSILKYSRCRWFFRHLSHLWGLVDRGLFRVIVQEAGVKWHRSKCRSILAEEHPFASPRNWRVSLGYKDDIRAILQPRHLKNAILPWWWHSGQRPCLLLWWSEFESHCWLLLCLEKTKINEEEARLGPLKRMSFCSLLYSPSSLIQARGQPQVLHWYLSAEWKG